MNADKMIVKPRKRNLFVGLLSTAMAIFLLVVLITNFDIDDKSEFIAVCLMLFFFTFGGVLFMLLNFNYRIILNSESIIMHDLFNKEINFKWTEVDKIICNRSKRFVLIKANDRKMKIYDDFIDNEHLLYHLKTLIEKAEFDIIIDQT